jgi:hypothetical protein
MNSVLPLTTPDLSAETDRNTTIIGIDQPVLLAYFATLNAGDFQATANLFAPAGVLQPPFEATIAQPAIAAYLEQEAKGFVLQPQQGEVELQADGTTMVQIMGSVQTPLFTVNVGWQFVLDAEPKILLAKIKLLASMETLLKLRP